MTRTNKKRTIMLAAEKLFVQRRCHEVTLDEVAQEAQVGKGTIYRHFVDKDDLFFQTATSGFEELCELIDQNIPATGIFDDRLMAACREITQFFFRRRQMFRLMQMEEGRVIWDGGSLWERWRIKRQQLVMTLVRILEQGRKEGRVRSDIPLEVPANLLMGMLLTRARYMAGNDDPDRHLELVISFFLFGAAGPDRP